MAGDAVTDRFRKTLARHSMVRRREKVLLALSGGADSTCLLHLFLETRSETGVHLVTAHFNHRLRGRSSDADASFVRDLSARHGLNFLSGSAGPAALKGRSTQEAAREERLDFLIRTAREEGCRRVALGHNADDQAETMLMRFIAGGGPLALGGIPPVSHGGIIIHPLLDIRRCEIEAYLRKRKIRRRQDSSNRKLIYLRNRLRHRLLPMLVADYNPALVMHLAELAGLLRRDSDLLEELARPLLDGARRRGGAFFFPFSLLQQTHPALMSRAILGALRSLAPGADFGNRHLSALMGGSATARQLTWDLPGGITAVRDSRGLALLVGELLSKKASTPQAVLRVPGGVLLPSSLGRVTATVRRRSPSFDPRHLPGLPWRAALDWARVAPPLTVRFRRPGDRFRPLGLPDGKKLKDVFIDGKIPRLVRDRLPLVCDREGIVWVPGVRPAHRCRVKAATAKVLLLRADRDLPDELFS